MRVQDMEKTHGNPCYSLEINWMIQQGLDSLRKYPDVNPGVVTMGDTVIILTRHYEGKEVHIEVAERKYRGTTLL